ncbi:hypothetical protein DM02DRAFT_619679 [Periconia macrospinosa]|uniref:PD-(D/E)XK nuclease-like domain-containing protein n=1 Tax=Periconia macrospinosa TaxID=97972 RepID=A0A2V1D482_9PLEO|nr:hypothetical protein DM02DRAFT_619679 [Periconia macrospinosa]
MPSDFIISSWLADVNAATPTNKSSSHGRALRKRAHPAPKAEAPPRKKQRATANMNAPSSPPNSDSRSRSPAKSQSLGLRTSQRLRGRDQRPVQQVEAPSPPAPSTNKPATVLVNPGHNAPILSPPISSSSQYTAALNLDAATSASRNSTGTRSQTSSRRTRTPSPKKTLRDLGMLDKPIEYVSNRSRLPPETLPHWQALGSIYRDVKTIPVAVAPRLADEFIQEDMIDHNADREGVELEHETLLEVQAEARQCADNGSHEAQWNTKVHDRVLSCALRPFKPHFESINITSAKPIPNFAPLYKDDPSNPKIVDFSINLVHPRGSRFESAIHSLLHKHPQFLSINQTFNEAYKKPAVMSIKTKRGFYKKEDARFKLGMWIAA